MRNPVLSCLESPSYSESRSLTFKYTLSKLMITDKLGPCEALAVQHPDNHLIES